MNHPPIQKHLNERAWRVLEAAREHCESLFQRLTQITDGFLAEKSLDPEAVCFVVVGSVGRFEALRASDVDFTPVLKDQPPSTNSRATINPSVS
jgi:signal-transduction protein with cAMP-binding, CBS, and nucleotidyltransferase domain